MADTNTKKKMLRCNIANVKYAVKNGDSWGDFVEYGPSAKLAIQAESSSTPIYGDGEVIMTLVREKNKTATLTTLNICDSYEIAMGRKMQVDQGVVDIAQSKSVEHVIYFETQGVYEDGETYVAKTMLYGVTSTRPAETYDQNTDEKNMSSFDTNMSIKGIKLKKASGGGNFKDANGNEVIVWNLTVEPNASDYDSFGSAVVEPTK